MTRRKKIWALVLAVLILLMAIAFSASRLVGHDLGSSGHLAVQDVSLINLIATPEKYDGKWVRVEGVCSFEFEGNALFLSREDRKYGFTKNAIWAAYETLGAEPYDLAFMAKFNGRHVLVEGRFDAHHGGHLGLFSGALTNVNRIITK
jgi:hypothetical protein